MNEHIKNLIKLTQENPKLEIITMVNYEVVCDDTFSYWKGQIEDVRKTVYFEQNEHCYWDQDEILEQIENDLEYDTSNFEEYIKGRNPETHADEIVNDIYDALLKEGKIKEVIAIFIGV